VTWWDNNKFCLIDLSVCFGLPQKYLDDNFKCCDAPSTLPDHDDFELLR